MKQSERLTEQEAAERDKTEQPTEQEKEWHSFVNYIRQKCIAGEKKSDITTFIWHILHFLRVSGFKGELADKIYSIVKEQLKGASEVEKRAGEVNADLRNSDKKHNIPFSWELWQGKLPELRQMTIEEEKNQAAIIESRRRGKYKTSISQRHNFIKQCHSNSKKKRDILTRLMHKFKISLHDAERAYNAYMKKERRDQLKK